MQDQATTTPRIKRVVIVGGGTAGWMAALYLNHFTRRQDVTIVLVESPIVGSIGVGEATIPSIVEFVRTLGLDEKAFMRRCSASFKLAIRFEDWRGAGSSYWHAFGPCGGQINGLDLFHFWLKRRSETGDGLAYTDHSAHVRLCEGAKAAWPYDGTTPISQMGSYAYHLDASALADYLRELATGAGVQHLFGHVQSAALDARGHIASLDIGGDRRIAGDLFLDATGFAGRLIEKEVGDPWIDWSRFMLCDSAVALPLPREPAFPPYTLSRAMPAGWMWRIPLNSRVGSGYVYSSAHLSEDEATAALIARSGLRKERAADPRALKIRVGRRTRFWARNCVALGLASGFVEPLESTGIHIIQKAIKLLVQFWPDSGFDDAPRRAYNRQMSDLYDEVRDFIMLHYALANRDEPFWRHSREAVMPDSLREKIALYDEAGRLDLPKMPVFLEPSYYAIFAGNERLPRRSIIEVDHAQSREAWTVLDQIRTQNRQFADHMPAHAAYLDALHRVAV